MQKRRFGKRKRKRKGYPGPKKSFRKVETVIPKPKSVRPAARWDSFQGRLDAIMGRK